MRPFSVQWKYKIVADTVYIGPSVKHIPINLVVTVVSERLNSAPKIASMFYDLSGSDPSLKRAMNNAKAKHSFLEFCEHENVQPTAIIASIVQMPYQGEPGQDGVYQISVDEFRRFIKTHGIDVTYSWPAPDDVSGASKHNNSDQYTQNLDEESAFNSLSMSESHKGRVVRIGHHEDFSGPDIAPDDWGAEFEASFAASEAKSKEKLKKKILKQPPPGKLPNTRIGKLVVKIAWEIEVNTGQRATCKEVVNRLCELAATVNEIDFLDADLDCLVRADTSVLGKERVRYQTKGGDERWYSHGTCHGTLTTWRHSLPQKTG